MLALASRVTRLLLEPEWFAGDFLTAPVTPVPDDPAATTHPKTAALTYVHVVAARLGHADPSITLRVYAHVINEQLVEAADIFAKQIKAA